MALRTSAILKCCLSNNQSTKILQLFRGFHHVRPVIKYNLTKPETDVDRYDPEGTFSPMVREFIKARDFENAGGKMLDVVSLHTGEKKGSVIVNDFVFGTNTRMDILQRNVVWYRACIRAGTACVKRRGEVRGGGRKPWPQKGTGRARQGSIRAPHWRKGGSAKGPKPRDWSYNLPYKVRRLGLRSALSCRLAQGDLTIVEDLKDLPGSSKDVLYLLQSRGLENSLIVDGFENKQLESLVRDMEKVDVSHALFLHVYGILKRRKLVLSLQALRLLEEKLCEDNRIVTVPEYELYHQDMLLDKSLLFHEYDPKSDTLRGNLIPKPPRKTLRSKLAVKKKLPMSRQDLKR